MEALPEQEFDLRGGAILKVLTLSDHGAILLLEWDQFKALLPLGADLESQENMRIGKDVGEVGVLLMADQGYAQLNSPEWIPNLRPKVASISVAADVRDGRPDREKLDALSGYSLLRTDQHGWTQIVTDGMQMWVEIER